MPKGTVKRFDSVKGYGFIRQDGIDPDIFVHHTHIVMVGFRTLFPGQEVEYELKKDARGWKAVSVRVIGGEPAPGEAKAS
jgi:cold shock protein